MITYCASECGNKECERHILKAPTNIPCSFAYFYEQTNCKEFKARISINEILENLGIVQQNK